MLYRAFRYLSPQQRYRLFLLTRRGAQHLRFLGDHIKKSGRIPKDHHKKGNDVEFIMRLAHRPSWWYHRKRLLRVARKLQAMELPQT